MLLFVPEAAEQNCTSGLYHCLKVLLSAELVYKERITPCAGNWQLAFQ